MIVVILHRRHYLQPEFVRLCSDSAHLLQASAVSRANDGDVRKLLVGLVLPLLLSLWYLAPCFMLTRRLLVGFALLTKSPFMHASACSSPSSRTLLHLAGGETNDASLPAHVCLSAFVEPRKESLPPSGSAQCSGTSLKVITAWRKKMGRPEIHTTSRKFGHPL